MRFLPFVTAAILALAACGKAEPTPPPPVPEVSVVTVAPRTIADQVELAGEVQAFRTVQVRAEVTGVIVDRPFREGAQVRAGTVLFRIDPTTYEANLRSALARAAESEAQFANAETNVNRLRPLLANNAVARQDVDNAEYALRQTRAAVDDARAAVDRARKDFNETVVRAEIAGRVGRAQIDVGTRVTGPGDVLTTLDVLDPIYVSFRPSAQQLLNWRRNPQTWRAIMPGGSVRVEALLSDGTTFPTVGRIGFVDPVVDPQTGTQEYRAQFTNPDHIMLPGQFVRVRLLGIERDSALVVPQRAVQQQLGQQSVYVVGKGDTVSARRVMAAGWTGGNWLIQSGLQPGDRVVVDGVQKIGPGSVVRPTVLVDSTAREGTSQDDSAAGGDVAPPGRN